ncbi:MAG: hypothetical protein P4N59_25565 [Negativicutes bacterium]|nr:hypothetical protein [Negativicutes bacterium]
MRPLSDLELLALEVDSYAGDPSLFIDQCIVTRDEADAGRIKPMPRKDYLYLIDRRFSECPVLAIPKSRRMLVTWRLLALHLWHGLFQPNQTIFIQSKKAEDSAYLLGDDRLLFLYRHLPQRQGWPKITRKIKDAAGKGYSAVQLDNGTAYYAVAEGADQLRQYTASRVYCTEMAFWDRAEATWTSLRPTIQGGGRIVIDSSANPGFFQRLVEGDL